jgi:hypothetical protein
MKMHSLCLSGILVAVLANASSQETHISSKYYPDSKETVVSTDPMFIVHTDDWRMAIEFSFRYPKQKLVKPAKRISISLKSLAKEIKYPKTNDQKFSLVADGEQINVEDLGYLPTNWVFEKDKLIGVTLRNLQVKNGKVLDENGRPISGPIQEWFTANIGGEKFIKLGNAQNIEIRVGSETYRLTPNQVNTVHGLAAMTIP